MRKLYHRGFVTAVALSSAAWMFTSTSAHAGLMYSYDIDSLAFAADEVVLVTKVKAWEEKEVYRKFETVRIKRIYAPAGKSGPTSLHEGDQIDLEWSCYDFEPMWGWNGTMDDGSKLPIPKVSDDRIVFLSKVNKAERSADDPHKLDWALVTSGARIFVDGRVHGFAQEMNPGCYGPRPGEGPKFAPYTQGAFEPVLLQSIANAATTRKLLADPPSADRTNKLLSMIGPAPDAQRTPAEITHDRDRGRGGRDSIGEVILTQLSKERNVDAVLDGRLRAKRINGFYFHHEIPAEKLVDIALSAKNLPHRRAALMLLSEMFFELSNKPELGPPLARLISDPDPSIRIAVLDVRFSDGKTPKAFQQAILDRFPIEKDANVRYALFERARSEKLFDRLVTNPKEMPLAMWHLESGNLTLGWATISGNAGWASTITQQLSRDGKVVSREVVPREQMGSSSSTDSSSVYFPLTVPKGVAPGRYDVRVELKIENDRAGGGSTFIERVFDIGPADLDTRIDPPKPKTSPAPAGSTATAGGGGGGDSTSISPSDTDDQSSSSKDASNPGDPQSAKTSSTPPSASKKLLEMASDNAASIIGGLGLAVALDFVVRRIRRKKK